MGPNKRPDKYGFMKILPGILSLACFLSGFLLVWIPAGGQVVRDNEETVLWALYDSAEAASADIPLQESLAVEIAGKARNLNLEELLLKAQLLVMRASGYTGDSTHFRLASREVLDIAGRRRDTAALTRAYFVRGMFFFNSSHFDKGIRAFKEPWHKRWHNRASLEDYVSIMGALADLSLSHERNVDSTLYYLQHLLYVAEKYQDPSAYLISSAKFGYLYSKSYNYGRALDYLRTAYPFVDRVSSKGHLLFYFSQLIDGFIETGELDSARHYLELCKEKAGYPVGDPRHCTVKMRECRLRVEMGESGVPDQDLLDCYQQFTQSPARKRNALNTRLIISRGRYNDGLLVASRRDALAAIEEARSMKDLPALNKGFELLALIEENIGNMPEALAAYKEHLKFRDSLNRVVFREGEQLLDAQYNAAEKERQNDALRRANEVAMAKLRVRDLTVFGISVITILLIIITLLFLQVIRQGRKRNEILGNLVAERTSELAAVNASLVSSNEALMASNAELERFAFIASHDLKEPLRNVLSFSGLLARSIDAEDEDTRAYLDFIMQGGRQMHRLVEDTLEYSAVRREETEFGEVDLPEIIREVEFALRETIEQRGARIIRGGMPKVSGDRRQLKLIFHNLLENALEYNDADEPVIKIDYWQDRKQGHCISVSDNGPGIPEEYRQKVFDLFTRLNPRSDHSGSGIGLAIVRKIVRQHGGDIKVESQQGGGARFTFTLRPDPLVPAAKGMQSG